MFTAQRSLASLVLVLAVGGAPSAQADDVSALQAENARLKARVAELERENAKLRGAVSNAEPAIPTRVVERENDDGAKIWTTEPAPVETWAKEVLEARHAAGVPAIVAAALAQARSWLGFADRRARRDALQAGGTPACR